MYSIHNGSQYSQIDTVWETHSNRLVAQYHIYNVNLIIVHQCPIDCIQLPFPNALNMGISLLNATSTMILISTWLRLSTMHYSTLMQSPIINLDSIKICQIDHVCMQNSIRQTHSHTPLSHTSIQTESNRHPEIHSTHLQTKTGKQK